VGKLKIILFFLVIIYITYSHALTGWLIITVILLPIIRWGLIIMITNEGSKAMKSMRFQIVKPMIDGFIFRCFVDAKNGGIARDIMETEGAFNELQNNIKKRTNVEVEISYLRERWQSLLDETIKMLV